MFNFLHKILLYGYNGKSSSSRGRSQKGFVKKSVTLPADETRSLRLLQDLLNVGPDVQERQLDICKLCDDYTDDFINRPYLYLSEVQNANEKLYFTLLGQYIEQYLPIIKTPSVATPCKNLGVVYKKPKGLLINIHDKGQVYRLLQKWPKHDIRAIIVTENGRTIGQEGSSERSPFGVGIPMSKLSLYTTLAGIKPNQCLPITLDIGTDNLAFLEDPAYIGIKERRLRGKEYNEFIDEFMNACFERFGPNTIVYGKNKPINEWLFKE